VLTRQGWMVAGGAVALVVAGRLLGLVELYALGAVVGVLVGACALLVTSSRLELEVGRSVHPGRVHVGSSSRVELRVRNRRAARTPVLELHDPVTGTRGADLLLAPLTPGEVAVAAYRLPTTRRGLLHVGPLDVLVGDPFGLTRVRSEAAPRAEVIVYPKVEEIRPLPHTTGNDRRAGARQPNALGRTGEDFYALRPYVVGDDLRRVHWPSSARHDELLVRQDELPWQGRTTVLLDVRADAHRAASGDGASLEAAVSVAASVVTASARRTDLVRLATTAGTDSEFGGGSDHLEALMEHLAVVEATGRGSLRGVVDRLGRHSSGGSLVAVLADPPDDDLRAVAGLRSRYGAISVVVVEASGSGTNGGRPRRTDATAGLVSVRLTGRVPFATAWEDHLARVRQRSLAGRRG
jgi:uncharacterized protein (DUF58 family)